MAKIDAVEIPTLLFDEQAGDPSTPGSDLWRLYFKSGGLFAINDAGTVVGPFAVSSGSAAGNLWAMAKSSSQTLTNNTQTDITFDVAHIGTDGSVIDLTNNRFVAPATGRYQAYMNWIWEGTAPVSGSSIQINVGGTAAGSLIRIPATPITNGSLQGMNPLSLTSGDFVTVSISPGAVTGATARGNASVHLRCTFTLIRVT
jgi:hypothetical protein